MTSVNFGKRAVSLLFFVILLISVLSVGTLTAFADTQQVKSYGAFNYRVAEEGLYITGYTGEMTSVSIPNTIEDRVVVGIDAEAFWYRDDITNVDLPSYLETIGERAFQGCSSITEIVIPDTVYEISDAAFESCKKLSSVNIPRDLGYVGAFAFDGTPWIERFTDNTSIIFGGRVFYRYLGDAEKVTIPYGVISISANAFNDKENLSFVSIPNTVQIIGNFAFCNCPNLKSVSLPSSLYLMGEYSFGCFEDNENKAISVYDDFKIYSETKGEDGEDLVAVQYCEAREIELLPPSEYATPDEIPEAEKCVAKELETAKAGGKFNENGISTLILIVVSCVVVIAGLAIFATVSEKKKKGKVKKNKR
ncbi:MAG: leucine-rich repeat domain-containing protein [Eubacteriales bacterium]|nr:leucine-rich repeat domain-containing protein [Eubacteriales bacterium]